MKRELKVLIVRGPTGSGKSTISKEVGKRFKDPVIVLNKDAFIDGLRPFNIEKLDQDKIFTIPMVESALKENINVIIDGLYAGKGGPEKIERIAKAAKKNKAKFYVFNLNCSLKTSFKRIDTRKGHIVNKGYPKEERIKWYNYFYECKYNKAHEINTEKLSQEKTIDFILKKIGEK
jgi:predicted ABC-type ATPase